MGERLYPAVPAFDFVHGIDVRAIDRRQSEPRLDPSGDFTEPMSVARSQACRPDPRVQRMMSNVLNRFIE